MVEKKWIIALLLSVSAIFVIAAGSFFYLKFYGPSGFPVATTTNFSNTFASGVSRSAEGEYAQAAMQYEKALQKVTTKEEEGLARLYLAIAVTGTDVVRGIEMLKEISRDETLPGFYRAGGAIFLLQLFSRSHDPEFVGEHLFTGEVWASFAKDTPRTYAGVELAVRRAFEWSTELHSLFEAEYRIALWYMRKVYFGSLSPKERAQYQQIAEERTIKGDTALRLAIDSGITPHSEIGLGYNLKATLLEFKHALGEASLAEVEDAYQNALTLLGTDPAVQSRFNEFYARLEYSNFLARLDRAAYLEKIKTVLTPLYLSSMNVAFDSATSRIKNKADTPFQLILSRIAAIDPRFKNKIETLGWIPQ